MSSRAVASSSMTRTRSAVGERRPSAPVELFTCESGLAGRRSVKTEPLPSSLVTVTSPPIRRASLRVMAKPRPVPPYCREVEESACVNSSNNLACCSGVIPMPVSATAISIQSRPSTTLLTRSLTSPCWVNLQALLNRLSRICRSRMGSTVKLPRLSGLSTTRRFLLCSASCRAVPMMSSSSGATLTVSGLSSSLPASILERSSTWLMSPRRWVPAPWTRRSGSTAFSVPKRGALLTIISVSPMMALSGVRSKLAGRFSPHHQAAHQLVAAQQRHHQESPVAGAQDDLLQRRRLRFQVRDLHRRVLHRRLGDRRLAEADALPDELRDKCFAHAVGSAQRELILRVAMDVDGAGLGTGELRRLGHDRVEHGLEVERRVHRL